MSAELETTRPRTIGAEGVVSRREMQLVLLALAVSVGIYARAALGPLQETMRLSLQLTDNEMALLQGPALGLPIVLGAVPLGLAIDRRSRSRFIVIFTALTALGSLLTAVAPSFTTLLAARCLIGLTAPATWIATVSLLADWYGPAQRGRANMIVIIAQSLGSSAVFAAGGTLLTIRGSDPDAWRWSLLWLTAPVALTVCATLALREPPRVEVAIKNPSLKEAWRELCRYRGTIISLLTGLACVGIADFAVLTWVAPTLARNFGLGPDRVGGIMGGVLLIGGVLGPLTGGILADYCQRTGGPRRTIRVLALLSLLIVPLSSFAFVSTITAVSVLLAAFLTIVIAILVAGPTLFTIVIPNELRGLCTALLSASFQLFGLGLAPLIVSTLSGVLGGPALIGKSLAIVCITTSLIAAAVLAFGRRYLPERTERE